MMPDIFDIFTTGRVKWRKDGIVIAIEFNGRIALFFTELSFKRRGYLDPALVQQQLYVAMKDKEICAQHVHEVLRSEVVTDIGEYESRGKLHSPCQGNQKHGFLDAISPASTKGSGGFVVIEQEEGGVWIISYPIPSKIEQLSRTVRGIRGSFGDLMGQLADAGIIAIDGFRGLDKGLH